MPDSTADSIAITNVSVFEKRNISQQNKQNDHHLLPCQQPSSSDSSTNFLDAQILNVSSQMLRQQR
jgi:hypothetical protein